MARRVNPRHHCPRCLGDRGSGCWCDACHKAVVKEMHDRERLPTGGQCFWTAAATLPQTSLNNDDREAVRLILATLEAFKRRHVHVKGSGFCPDEDTHPMQDVALRAYEEA
jgi:hypothetical protein